MLNLYIINELGGKTGGGIKTYIRELTVLLKCTDINATVINLKSEKHKIEQEEMHGVNYWHIPEPINKYFRNELYYGNVVYILKSILNIKKNMIFHLNYNHSLTLAEKLKKAFKCKIVTSVHYFNWCFPFLGNVSQFRKAFSTWKTSLDNIESTVGKTCEDEKEYFELVDNIICLSENMQQILIDDYKINSDKITLIFNGLSDINHVLNKSNLRQKYQLEDELVFLFVGKIEKVKGLTYVLQAFRKLLYEHQAPCRLIIAGKGAFDAYLKECEDIWFHINWLGQIDKDKLYELYSIADVGVMPSFHEQCSYAAIEMMMFGLPIVGSTTTGLKEMIVNEETGLHVPVIEHIDKTEIDVEVLAEKMLYLLQNKELRQRMGINARKRYEKLYSSEIMRENMINFYNKLI